jgi:hypothetical protein
MFCASFTHQQQTATSKTSKSQRPRPAQKPPSEEIRFQGALRFSLKWEEGYGRHAADLGGLTRAGVPQMVYDELRTSKRLPLQDVGNISPEEIREHYYKRWQMGKCDRYQPPLDFVCLDTWVNFTPTADGAGSFFANLPLHPRRAALEVLRRRKNYRWERAWELESQSAFLQGWLNRDKALEEKILQGYFE